MLHRRHLRNGRSDRISLGRITNILNPLWQYQWMHIMILPPLHPYPPPQLTIIPVNDAPVLQYASNQAVANFSYTEDDPPINFGLDILIDDVDSNIISATIQLSGILQYWINPLPTKQWLIYASWICQASSPALPRLLIAASDFKSEAALKAWGGLGTRPGYAQFFYKPITGCFNTIGVNTLCMIFCLSRPLFHKQLWFVKG